MTFLPSTSALSRSIHGDQALWSTSDHLLAAAVDALSAGNWQRGGGKGKRPQPVPRPGGEDRAKTSKTMGTGRRTIADAKAFYDRVNRPTRLSGCYQGVCGRPVKARGMCPMHYQRWWRANRA